MVHYHLTRAEKWVFSQKFQQEGERLAQLSKKDLPFELYAVNAGDKVLFSQSLIRRQRKFIQECNKIKNTCSPAQRELIIRLATDSSARSPLPPDMIGSHPECAICENHCCYTGIYDIKINGKDAPREDCPFLKDHRCVVYDVRPEICRNYLCQDILNLPKGYTLIQLVSEYYGDYCEGLPVYGREIEKVTIAIPQINVDVGKNIHLAHGKDYSYKDCGDWKTLRDLGALEMKYNGGKTQYVPI